MRTDATIVAKVTQAAVASASHPDVLAFDCPDCDQARVFRIAHRHTRWFDQQGPAEEYTYAVCPSCSGPIVLLRENYGDGFEADSYGRMYPPVSRRLPFSVPNVVRRSYDEAVKCEDAKAWTAVAVMVGRSLEAICHEFDAETQSIHDGLKRMLTAGAISQELHDWGDGLRLVRNEGAHATTTHVSQSDAVHALDFLQALIEILFDLRARFEEWQQERAARSAKEQAVQEI